MKLRSIILVILDALRRDHLGIYGYKKSKAKNIDRLGKKSIVFWNAYTKGTTTYLSIRRLLSLRDSYNPLEYLVVLWEQKPFLRPIKRLRTPSYKRGNNNIPNWYRVYLEINEKIGLALYRRYLSFPTVFSILSKKWVVGIVAANAFYYFLRRDGIDYLKIILESPEKIKEHIPTDPFKITEEGIRFIKKHRDQPFLLLLHYFQPHEPYISPYWKRGIEIEELKQLASEIRRKGKLSLLTLERIRNAYDACIKWVDKALKPLIRYAKKADVVLTITADHGQLLGEHGYLGHPAHASFDELTHIPLIVYGAHLRPTIIFKKFYLHQLIPYLIELAIHG